MEAWRPLLDFLPVILISACVLFFYTKGKNARNGTALKDTELSTAEQTVSMFLRLGKLWLALLASMVVGVVLQHLTEVSGAPRIYAAIAMMAFLVASMLWAFGVFRKR